MKSIVSDLFRETKDGKVSSKKFWGHIFMLLIGLTYVADGLHWYEVATDLFNPLLIAGCTLIGLNTIGGMFKDKPNEQG